MADEAFPLTDPLRSPGALFALATSNPVPQTKISELTNFLNGRGVPYEVREWKIGDYGWVVQPDAGRRPAAGEVRGGREDKLHDAWSIASAFSGACGRTPLGPFVELR